MNKLMMVLVAMVLACLVLACDVLAVNFTNAVRYKIDLAGVELAKAMPLDDSESGDYAAQGRISYTLPVAHITNMPIGVNIREQILLDVAVHIIVRAAEVQAQTGTNEQIKVNKALREKVRALGANLKAELP